MNKRDEEILSKHLARIRAEAEAIADSTAEATARILDLCDALSERADATVKTSLETIYEICAVQDFTHQRVNRIQRVIGQIEGHITEEDDPLLEGPQSKGTAMEQGDIDSFFDKPE